MDRLKRTVYFAYRKIARFVMDLKPGERTEEEPGEREDHYHTLFERLPVGLYRTTPDGRILDANPALVRLLGYPDRKTLLATNARDIFVNPEDRRQEQELLQQAGVLNSIELQLRRYDGTVIWVKDSVQSVKDIDDKVLYYEGSLEDITEHKQTEKYLLRTERLAAMGRVASSLAHEIKNPLQAIQNNLSLVMDFPLDPEERNGCLRICRDEVERLTEITQRMLSFARTERQTVHPISIPQVWKETAALLRPSLGKSAVRMATTFPADLPMAMGVADQISQVLLNLALNSIEAMPGGGNIHIVASAQDDQVLVTLTNDGPPIPEEHLEHLFEPFFTTKPEGTGLGLFICHNIVQQHGGSLSVENLRDKAGVMYTLTLPAAPGHPLYTLASSEGSRS